MQTSIIRMGINNLDVQLEYFNVHAGVYDNVTSRNP